MGLHDGMVAGTMMVTLSGTTITETPSAPSPDTTANLAAELYFAAKMTMGLSSLMYPRGFTVTASPNPGDTMLDVGPSDVSWAGWEPGLAYNEGDTLGQITYQVLTMVPPPYPPAPPTTPGYKSATQSMVASSFAAEVITLQSPLATSPAPSLVPPPNPPATPATAQVLIAPGTKFGFTGTLSEWQAQVAPALYKQLKALAAQCNAQASAIVAHIQNNAIIAGSVPITGGEAEISTSLGGLQTSTAVSSPTNPPATPQTIPVTGTVVLNGGTVS